MCVFLSVYDWMDFYISTFGIWFSVNCTEGFNRVVTCGYVEIVTVCQTIRWLNRIQCFDTCGEEVQQCAAVFGKCATDFYAFSWCEWFGNDRACDKCNEFWMMCVCVCVCFYFGFGACSTRRKRNVTWCTLKTMKASTFIHTIQCDFSSLNFQHATEKEA